MYMYIYVCMYICVYIYIYIYINLPVKIRRLNMSRRFPTDMRIPPLETKVLLESKPPKSRILVRRWEESRIRLGAVWHDIWEVLWLSKGEQQEDVNRPISNRGSRIPGSLLLLTWTCLVKVQISQRLGPLLSRLNFLKTGRRRERGTGESLVSIRKGTNGVSTNEVTANPMFFDRGTFWVLPSTYFYQKCQGVPSFPICQIHYFCSGPISVDPICPQPELPFRPRGHRFARPRPVTLPQSQDSSKGGAVETGCSGLH